MYLMEFSVVPLGQGESVGQYVAQCVDLVDASGLDYRLHAMGTTVEGDLAPLLELLRKCTELVANQCNRVTVTAKFDYRHGRSQMLDSKVSSIERRLGREVSK